MADQFFYKRDPSDAEQGPIDAKTLKKLAHSGELLPASQLRREGGDWVAASSVKGLFPEAAAAEPPAGEIPSAVPISPAPAEAGGIKLPSVAPKKAAPDLPAGLDSLVIGGKKSSAGKPAAKKAPETKPTEAKPPAAAPSVESPQDEAAPPESEPAPNPFASDSNAADRPHRKVSGGLGALFSFDTVIGPAAIKMMFYLATILTLLAWLAGSAAAGLFTIAILGSQGTIGIITVGAELLFGLLVASMVIVVYRVIAEIVITFFLVHEDVRDIRQLLEEKSGVID